MPSFGPSPGSFDTTAFLRDWFRSPDEVVQVTQRHLGLAPRRDTVRKWFTRGAIPSEWWPMLLIAIDREHGTWADLDAYLEPGGSDDIFA